uniref:Uncharacterized protein n=1 Tax=Anguilla anguilla TaxID=7936 RepID=A0A0E9PLI0_ANGAN
MLSTGHRYGACSVPGHTLWTQAQFRSQLWSMLSTGHSYRASSVQITFMERAPCRSQLWSVVLVVSVSMTQWLIVHSS